MGHWQVISVSKDDPDAVVIFRSHQYGGTDKSAFLSTTTGGEKTGLTRPTPWPHMPGYTVLGSTADSSPLEIQITSGNGLTAIVLVQEGHVFAGHETFKDCLVVHGQVEGGRHQFGWRDLVKGKSYGSITRKMSVHVGADGIVKFLPETKFSFLSTDGSQQEFSHLEIKVPLFASTPSHEASTSAS